MKFIHRIAASDYYQGGINHVHQQGTMPDGKDYCWWNLAFPKLWGEGKRKGSAFELARISLAPRFRVTILGWFFQNMYSAVRCRMVRGHWPKGWEP